MGFIVLVAFLITLAFFYALAFAEFQPHKEVDDPLGAWASALIVPPIVTMFLFLLVGFILSFVYIFLS